jgi:transcriptional regulator with XRE-family HTH domain
MGRILNNSEIGAKIRQLRTQAGLTQERIAEKLEITFQQVQKYEKGLTKVNLIKLQQIAEIFQVPVSAFFEESTHQIYNLTEEELELLQAFRDINDTLRSSIIEITRNLKKSKS